MESNEFKGLKRDLAKETGKTLAFFFVGVPLAVFAAVWLLI